MSMQVKQSILKIHPYKQGESEVNGVKATIKLSSNESTLGPSPRAKAAFIKAAQELNRYPDGGQTELRKAIAEAYQLPADQIVCGNGSEELIQLLIRAYCSEGDEVLMSENGFVMCKIHSLAQGAVPVFAPEKNDCIDVDALLQRVSSKTRMVIIANPNNPTGTYVTRSEVERLHAGLRDDILLLLDGAYAEYVSREDYTAGSSLVQENDNVVMTRTFSKIYGLSALRIGWAYCPISVIDIVQRIRTPFNTNSPALAAAAAAVLDVDYTETVRRHNQKWLDRFQVALPKIGIDMLESVTNFYLLRFPTNQNRTMQGADAALKSQGIIPRPTQVGDSQELRITIGNDAENEAVLAVLKDYMAA